MCFFGFLEAKTVVFVWLENMVATGETAIMPDVSKAKNLVFLIFNALSISLKLKFLI